MESITSLIIILMNNQLTVIFPEDYLNNSILSNLCWFGGSDMGRLLTLFKARSPDLLIPSLTHLPSPLLILTTKRHPPRLMHAQNSK